MSTDVIVYIDKDETPRVIAANELSVSLVYPQEDGSYVVLDYVPSWDIHPASQIMTEGDIKRRERSAMERFYMTNWTVDDVIECDNDDVLRYDECIDVLFDVLNNYDAEYGVNWEIINQNTQDAIQFKKEENENS